MMTPYRMEKSYTEGFQISRTFWRQISFQASADLLGRHFSGTMTVYPCTAAPY